jgi:hypothetical protein
MFRSRKHPVSVSIARAALELIYDECDRYNIDETGGRLVGTYQTKGSHFDVKVSGVIGPGPNAQRSNTSFFQDGDYQEKIFREIEAKHPDVEHLGNWHTHHVNGYPTLSGGDISTYRNIVNHRNHNTNFFYALLVVRKNQGGAERFETKHFFLRRGDDTVHEIPSADIHVIDGPLLLPADAQPAAPPTSRRDSGLGLRGHAANPERAKDNEFFGEFYPSLKALYSAKLSAPYWKGALSLIDGSTIDVVAVESTDGAVPEYSIVTAPDGRSCSEVLAQYKDRKFPAARHAVLCLERDLNLALYRNRK